MNHISACHVSYNFFLYFIFIIVYLLFELILLYELYNLVLLFMYSTMYFCMGYGMYYFSNTVIPICIIQFFIIVSFNFVFWYGLFKVMVCIQCILLCIDVREHFRISELLLFSLPDFFSGARRAARLETFAENRAVRDFLPSR